MEGRIKTFATAKARAGMPAHTLLSNHGESPIYLGTGLLDRCDGILVVVDLYTTTVLNPQGRWFPWLLVNWGDGDLFVRLDGVSNRDSATDNQVALKFLRDYVKENWWEIYTSASNGGTT